MQHINRQADRQTYRGISRGSSGPKNEICKNISRNRKSQCNTKIRMKTIHKTRMKTKTIGAILAQKYAHLEKK